MHSLPLSIPSLYVRSKRKSSCHPGFLFTLADFAPQLHSGNAAIIGLKTDLNLTPPQYNLCLTIFFIPYSLFKVPANLVLEVLKPSVWIPIMIVTWGAIAT